MTKIKTLTIQFDTPLRRSEIPLFRGAVIAAIPSNNILFHNHDGTALRYAYPLIQYKRIGGKAAIVCIGKGVEAVGELITDGNFSVSIGQKKAELRIEKIDAAEADIRQAATPVIYHLKDWLPLNENNYAEFQAIRGIAGKIEMLERILTGNILSLLKGLGIHIDFTLTPVITDYVIQKSISYKHVKLTSLDISFTANITLPERIGLGKHSSIGAGLLTKRIQNNQ